MLKKLLKTISLVVITVMASSIIACTYTADGCKKIQDVTFTVSCDGENIDGTLKLYETFAPETNKRVLSLIEKGFYNDTACVFDRESNMLILGAYTENNGEYAVKNYDGDAIKGEFTSNGFQSRLKATAGSLVMIREFDSGKGESKYNTAKATFAIMLGSSSVIDNSKYAVFGKIDDEMLNKLVELKDEVIKDTDGDRKVYYVGDRNENGVQTYENAKTFYITSSSSFAVMEGEIKVPFEDEEFIKRLDEEVTNNYYFDAIVLPTKAIKVGNFKKK